MATLEALQKAFLSSSHFAVVGASKDQSKFGTKILKWYQARKYDVRPIHPKESELEGLATLQSLGELPLPTKTSVSIITPPKVTLGILEEAKKLNIAALWLQPGAEDSDVLAYIEENLKGKVVAGGPCLLVEGDRIKSLL